MARHIQLYVRRILGGFIFFLRSLRSRALNLLGALSQRDWRRRLRATLHQLATWRPVLRAGARWAALSGAQRRVFAVALSLLCVTVLLTSSVSAALLSGHGVFSSAPGVNSFNSQPTTAPTSGDTHPSTAPTAGARSDSHTPTPTPSQSHASATPTPTAKGTPTATSGKSSTPSGRKAPPHAAQAGTSKQSKIHSSSLPYSAGDLFAGIGNGQIAHYNSAGTLLEVLDTGTGSSEDTGMCFDTSGNLYATDFEANDASEFDSAGNLLQSSWGSGYNYDPESCAIDNVGDIYVGQADGDREILKFDPSGNPLASYAPATEDRGTDWIDLAPDQCTIYYTSEGSSVKRFNVCSNSQANDFATGLANPCYALRIRTNGEVMVACESQVYRLSSAGSVLQTYPTSNYGASDFFALNLDPDGTSFWTAGESSTGIYRIDIASGNLLTSFNATVNNDIAGLVVFGEAVATVPDGPLGTERQGSNNPSELPYCLSCAGDPIDTYSGNFTHSFSDLTVPDRGIPLQLSHTYNASAAGVNGPLGYGWTGNDNASVAVDGTTGDVTVTQENGSTVGFTPNGSGGYTAPSRVLATLVKNGDGSYTFTRDQDQTHLTFNASGQLTSETDRNSYTTYLTYNGSNQLTTVTDAAGRSLSFSYDGSGRITSVTDPASRGVSFSYDGSGNLATYTDVNGGVWHFTYDGNHLLLTIADPRGGVTTNVYDGSDRVTSQTDAMLRKTTFSYTGPDSNGNSSTTVTDPNGNVTLENYIHGVLVSRTRGYGTAQAATWSYTYDPVSLGVTTTSDPDGHVTTKTWDASGNLLSKMDALGHTTTYTYNSFNEVTSTTDPLGVTTTNTYDANGNLLSTSTPILGTSAVATTTYTYGDATHPGDVTAMTDANGRTWRYTYDADGNRISAKDPLGDLTTSTFDAIGRLLTQVSPNGHVSGANPANYTTSYTYNAFGDVTQTTDPLGKTTTKQYDADRNVTQTTDADGHTTTNTYDLDDELTQVTRADGSTLKYTYDADGNQTGQTDGLNHTTTNAYDALNRLASTTDALNRTTSYSYDPAGNRTSMTDADGYVTTYGYDAANELVGISYSDGQTPNAFFTYDADGQRSTMYDGSGTTSDTYDSLHRLTQETNGAGQTVRYSYDLDGNLTNIVYPSGLSVTRSYDAAERWRTVYDGQGHTTRLNYDADGNLIQLSLPNGVDSNRAYDAAGRLATIADSSGGTPPFLSFGYTRDALGQVTAQNQLTASTAMASSNVNQTYGYTSLNQVSSLNGATYAYDKGDNLTTRGTATLAYDAADELSSLTSGATTSYSYDARGNRTQASVGGPATAVYGYDQANRLISYNASGASGPTTAQYTYDGDGLRASKTVNGGASELFAWDTAEGLPLLLQDGTTQYIYGPGGTPIEQVGGNGILYYLTDQLGSTRALLDAYGTVMATYTYDAYGTLLAKTGQLSAGVNPFGFAGQYTDTESGMIYLRARSYDPATAQFLTRDLLASLTQQPYAYALGNPLNMLDLNGLFPWDAIAAVAKFTSTVASNVAVGCFIAGFFTAGFGDLCAAVAEGVALGSGAVSTAADLAQGNTRAAEADAIGTAVDLVATVGGFAVEGEVDTLTSSLVDETNFAEVASSVGAPDLALAALDNVSGTSTKLLWAEGGNLASQGYGLYSSASTLLEDFTPAIAYSC